MAPITTAPGDAGCPVVQVNTGPFSRRKDPVHLTACSVINTESTDDFRKMEQACGTFSEFLMSSGKLRNHSITLWRAKEQILLSWLPDLKLSTSTWVNVI